MADYKNNEPHALDWDDEISNDGGQFVILEEGDYNFTVTAYERGIFPGGEKIPECKKVTFSLSVETDEGTAMTFYDLILWSTLEWKISEFFRAIGQKKHGEAFRPRWNEVIGSKGRAHFKPRTYKSKKDGEERQANDISKFYDYDPLFFSESTVPVFGAAPAYPPTTKPQARPEQASAPAKKWQMNKF